MTEEERLKAAREKIQQEFPGQRIGELVPIPPKELYTEPQIWPAGGKGRSFGPTPDYVWIAKIGGTGTTWEAVVAVVCWDKLSRLVASGGRNTEEFFEIGAFETLPPPPWWEREPPSS